MDIEKSTASEEQQEQKKNEGWLDVRKRYVESESFPAKEIYLGNVTK